MRAVDNPDEFLEERLFFLNGPGGTGKTIVQNTVMERIRFQGKVALAVVSSGITSTLLEGGRTVYSRFKIPLDAEETSYCGVKKKTNLAELLKRAEVIFWDEAPMQSRYDMEAVNRLFQDMCGYDSVYFTGKVVCFCGDFRQTLLVVPKGSAGAVINRCIQSLFFQEAVIILNLTINERLNYSDLLEQGRIDVAEFAEELLRVGDSNLNVLHPRTEKEKTLQAYNHLDEDTKDALIDKIYPRLRIEVPIYEYLSDRVILSIINIDVARINRYILDRLLGRENVYVSTDEGAALEDNDIYRPEYWYTFHKPSLLDYILKLKVETPIILIKNLQAPRLYNRTRLRVTRYG